MSAITIANDFARTLLNRLSDISTSDGLMKPQRGNSRSRRLRVRQVSATCDGLGKIAEPAVGGVVAMKNHVNAAVLAEDLLARRNALLRAMRIAVPLEVATKPYPEGLVPLWSQEGLALLEGSVGPFEKLALCMLGQGPLQCGVTSLAIALNTCQRRDGSLITTAELHEELRAAVRPVHRFFSASLSEIGVLAQRHAPAGVRVVYAGDVTCETFRSQACETLEAGGCVIANFKRSSVGYASPFAGHCSPLAAYNPGSDEFLVMDVARKSFQPVWVPASLLYEGMNTLEKPRDDTVPATATRGYILLGADHAAPRFVS